MVAWDTSYRLECVRGHPHSRRRGRRKDVLLGDMCKWVGVRKCKAINIGLPRSSALAGTPQCGASPVLVEHIMMELRL